MGELASVKESVEKLEEMEKASPRFILFFKEYPNNNVCTSFRRAVYYDSEDRFLRTASPFEEALFVGDIPEAYQWADPENEERLEELFPAIV